MTGQLPIADYGVIGDLHTAALIGRNGALDWLCLPRFDGPAVFAGLLDPDRGGTWRIAPEADHTSEQNYLPATNVLTTTFHMQAGGVVMVTDFMPVGNLRTGGSAVFRRIQGVRGSVPVVVRLEPRFQYGLRPAQFHRRQAGLLATDHDDGVLAVSSSPDVSWEIQAGVAEARLVLAPRETAWIVLRHDEDEVATIEALSPQKVLDRTAAWWDTWVTHLDYHGPWRREVERSALALKLLQYEPSGAFVASPTTSLPEWPAGERNWDYRYTWVRDSSYVLATLKAVGFRTEAEAYLAFFKRICRQGDASHLQILHAVDARRDVTEHTLEHLAGYGGARPVRIGNSAAHQFQLDVYGELLETLALGHRDQAPSEGVWVAIRRLVDWVRTHWQRPDFGLWEARQEPQHHVFSKVMAWRTLNRGTWLAERHGLPADLASWQATAQVIREEIFARGWDAERGCFVQAYGQPHLDASLLVLPQVGFLSRQDPRVRSTLDAIRRELCAGPEELLYRYTGPDGLAGEEGAFVVCSFWLVQTLALVGELEEAERLFRLLLRRTSEVGLLAEEIDPRTGAFLGNHPLGLSHAGLISTAVTLTRLRAAGAGTAG